jgi:hypothetical protein
MSRWLTEHLDPADLGELLKVDPEAQAQLERMPAILRETLLFPYQQGLIFANGIWARGGWEAIDRAYGRLPDSTEQVLHPSKYAAGEKPVDVALDGAALAKAMGAGWSGTPEDTLGEFQLSVWLRENGLVALTAGDAAAGWGGDRLAYLRGPAALLEFALIHFAMERLGAAGFTPVITPVMVRAEALYGTGFFPGAREQVYAVGWSEGEGRPVEPDGLYLVGTAEVPLAAQHTDEILDPASLPLRYAGFYLLSPRGGGSREGHRGTVSHPPVRQSGAGHHLPQ